MVTWRVPLSDLILGPEEKEAVQKVLDSGWLAMGEVAQNFEQAFADFIGVKHAIAVTNGTASLHLACAALGLGPEDEVIVPSLTFVATANAVAYTEAQPIFADITSRENFNISSASIEERITDRTRAIMVMHYGGYPCDMPAIMEIAKKHNLVVLEDAAHAPGAEINGRKMGTWGSIGSFSFFPNKNMTSGEGGMLTTDDDELAQKIRTLRSHGMTTLTWDRHRGHAWSYDVVALGFNYRLDEIRAALGLEQLKKLPHNNARRQELTQLYRKLFQEQAPDLIIPFRSSIGTSVCHILPVLLPEGINRTRFANEMKERQVQTSLHYPPIHLFTYYRKSDLAATAPLPLTEEVAAREVTLPLYPTMQDETVELVVQAVCESLKEASEPATARAQS